MRKIIVAAAAALAFFAAGIQARDSIDGNRLVVKPYKNGTFEAGEFRFGKAELFGYVGDLKDTKKITGILLRDGDKATPEQRHLIAEIAKAQELEATIELGGKQQPLVDPVSESDAAAAGAAGASGGR